MRSRKRTTLPTRHGVARNLGVMVQRFRPPLGMSPLRKTATGYETKIALLRDEDGTFGRECPNPDCRNYFKLYEDEFLAAPGSQLTCPACAHTGGVDAFGTLDQVHRIQAGQRQAVEAMAHAAIADFLRDMGGRTVKGKGFSLTYNTTISPPPPTRPLPTYEERATLRTFHCPNGHRAVIYDLLAACPYCGPDTPPRAIFDDNLAATLRQLDDADAMSPERIAGGAQTAAVEDALKRIVAALQNLAKQLHARADVVQPGDNPWQNAERLRKQWKRSFKADPLRGLDEETVKVVKLMFARRHALEHNGGVADARYIKETGEGTLNRRIRVRSAFVRQAIEATRALADQLQASLSGRP